MDDLKILTEQQFLEQLEFKPHIPPDVKTSVIFYVQHKNISFNPYLYSAILHTLDTVPDKKFIKVSEVFEIANKISEKFTIIQNDKYEKTNTENKYEKSENELPKNDPLQEEKISNILSFASSIEDAYESLTDDQKETVDTSFDKFVFNEDESNPISQLRKMIKAKDTTEEDLLKFLESQEKDDQFFKLLRTMYVRNNRDKKIFKKNFNKMVRILAGQKVAYEDISMDIFVDILKKRREEFNLAESDLVFDKDIQSTKHFKKTDTFVEDLKILNEELEPISEICSLFSQFQNSFQQYPLSEYETSNQEHPISDAELNFEQRVETLNIDLTSYEVFANLGLDGFGEIFGMYHDAPIPNEESPEPQNTNHQSRNQQHTDEKIKYSLKDRITGFLNIFVKKQNQLSNPGMKRAISSNANTESHITEEPSGILGAFKKGLKSLGTLFKHNKENSQNKELAHSDVDTQKNINTNIFTAGITPDTLTKIESVQKNFAKQTLYPSQSTPVPNNNITNEFDEH